LAASSFSISIFISTGPPHPRHRFARRWSWVSLNCGGSLVLYEINENGYGTRMVVFCSGIVSGILVAWVAGLFWLKIAGPAWHDFNQARKPHLPRSPSTA
jgi:hypothetical protein